MLNFLPAIRFQFHLSNITRHYFLSPTFVTSSGSSYRLLNVKITPHRQDLFVMGNIFPHAKNAPAIKDISMQGTAVFITIEPFPDQKEEEERLNAELERALGLRVFLKRTSP